MSPTSCQTAPPRARSAKCDRREEKLSQEARPTSTRGIVRPAQDAPSGGTLPLTGRWGSRVAPSRPAPPLPAGDHGERRPPDREVERQHGAHQPILREAGLQPANLLDVHPKPHTVVHGIPPLALLTDPA